jgi:hypothetical protein
MSARLFIPFILFCFGPGLSSFSQNLDSIRKAFNEIENETEWVDFSSRVKEFYQLQKSMKNEARAFELYLLYVKSRDSLNEYASRDKTMKRQTQREFDSRATADSIRISEEKKVAKILLEKKQTQRYALFAGLGMIAFFGVFMFGRFKTTQKQKRIIERQKSEVEKQKQITEEQRDIVEHKQKEILDSIRYAKRIQDSLLPNEKYIAKHLTKQ